MNNRQLTAFLKQLNRLGQSPHSPKKLLGHKIPPEDKVLLSYGRASSPLLQKRVNILVWNMFKAKKKGWADDLISLVSNKDIILLQEAYLRPVMENLLAQTSLFQWDLAQGFQRGKKKVSAGVMTGSITRPNEVFFLRSPDREPLLKTPKMAIGTIYKTNNSYKNLLVLNVHGINFVSLNKFKNHMLQLEMEMAGHEGPIIMGGDFNTWLPKRSCCLEAMADNLGLKLLDLSPDNRSRHLGRILDHVFTRDLKVISAACHPEVKSSDHQPIEITIEL